MVYRSVSQREFINAGFLFGPFVPLYGFGSAFLIFMEFLIHQWPLPIKIVVYGIVLTLIEYVTGFVLEKTFKLKLWDYSDNKFNIQGRVCLLFLIVLDRPGRNFHHLHSSGCFTLFPVN